MRAASKDPCGIGSRQPAPSSRAAAERRQRCRDAPRGIARHGGASWRGVATSSLWQRLWQRSPSGPERLGGGGVAGLPGGRLPFLARRCPGTGPPRWVDPQLSLTRPRARQLLRFWSGRARQEKGLRGSRYRPFLPMPPEKAEKSAARRRGRGGVEPEDGDGLCWHTLFATDEYAVGVVCLMQRAPARGIPLPSGRLGHGGSPGGEGGGARCAGRRRLREGCAQGPPRGAGAAAGLQDSQQGGREGEGAAGAPLLRDATRRSLWRMGRACSCWTQT